MQKRAFTSTFGGSHAKPLKYNRRETNFIESVDEDTYEEILDLREEYRERWHNEHKFDQ